MINTLAYYKRNGLVLSGSKTGYDTIAGNATVKDVNYCYNNLIMVHKYIYVI